MSRRDNVYCKKERNSALSNLAVSEHVPSPQLPLRGQEAACHCPYPFPAHPLCHGCQESVPIASGMGTPVNWELN